jgi:transcriptional regulator with GAF, ATPase, and Fis domain
MNIIDRESNKAKKDTIELFLLENQWNVSKAAKELRIDPANLHRYIRKFNLKRPEGVRVNKGGFHENSQRSQS